MPKLRRSTWIVLSLVTLIVIAHVFLWRSDMPVGEKLMWTVLNTIAWTIILAPVFLVDRWLDALRERNRAMTRVAPRAHLPCACRS
jgi:hypothetical protein